MRLRPPPGAIRFVPGTTVPEHDAGLGPRRPTTAEWLSAGQAGRHKQAVIGRPSFGCYRRGPVKVPHAHAGCEAHAVFRVGLVAMADPALDDLDRHALHGFGGVVHQPGLRLRTDETEQVARLLVVIVPVP